MSGQYWYACTQCGFQWREHQQSAPPSSCVVCGDRRITEKEHNQADE